MNCASFKAFLSFVFMFILRLIGCQLGWNGCPLIWKTFAILEEVFSLSLSFSFFYQGRQTFSSSSLSAVSSILVTLMLRLLEHVVSREALPICSLATLELGLPA